MKPRPYKPRTLAGAIRAIHDLQLHVAAQAAVITGQLDLLKEWKAERRLLAMEAAEGPTFDNPILAAKAIKLRDAILRDECGLDPEGRPLGNPKTEIRNPKGKS